MKILVTGFDPFGTDSINPSIEAVKKLPSTLGNAEIITLEVPTKFGESARVCKEKIAAIRPDYVVCIGQAGGRQGITPERVAINVDDARIPDNAGKQPLSQVIQSEGEAAYFSSLPIKAIVKGIKEAGLPANVSNSAGTFVCNHLMYQMLHLCHSEFPQMKAGFIHIPYLPEQVLDKPNVPSMSLENAVRALSIALETIVERDTLGDIEQV